MTNFQNLGLSIIISDPLWRDQRSYSDFTADISGYNHEIAALGGFKSAEISAMVEPSVIDEWLLLGLGRHVEIKDSLGSTVWEGFVNEVSATIGTLAVTRGPMMNVINRIAVVYTPILNIDTNPPIQGTKMEGLVAEDKSSQERYGILETIISGGSLVDDGTINEADMLRDAYLEEYRFPESSESVNLQSGSTPGLSLKLLGYDAFFDKYVYNNTYTGSTQLPTKLMDVLGADPNGVFNTNYSYISNATPYLLLVARGETESRTARAIINDLLTFGDANNLRTLLGVYENRTVHYNVVPSSIGYYHYISETSPHIETTNYVMVYPWNVRPGMWIFMPDYLAGRTMPTEDLRGDPRFIFVESVKYSSVWGLQINGLRFGKVKQLQAKLGSGVW